MKTIQRERPKADCTFSTFFNDDGSQICFLLEPPTPFPAGTYEIAPFLSPKHGYVVPCYQAIPGHTFVEQHPGNDERDTEDCQLPGDERGTLVIEGETYDAVLHSRETFCKMMREVYGFPDYRVGPDGKVQTALVSASALHAFLVEHPNAGRATIHVLDAVPVAA